MCVCGCTLGSGSLRFNCGPAPPSEASLYKPGGLGWLSLPQRHSRHISAIDSTLYRPATAVLGASATVRMLSVREGFTAIDLGTHYATRTRRLSV